MLRGAPTGGVPRLHRRRANKASLEAAQASPGRVDRRRRSRPSVSRRVHLRLVDVADDIPSEPLHRHFDRCLKFIARALLDGGRVLVHCFAGKSRSSTVAAAYADMATEGKKKKDTYGSHLRHARRWRRRTRGSCVNCATSRWSSGRRAGTVGCWGECHLCPPPPPPKPAPAQATRLGRGGVGGAAVAQLGEPICG